MLQSRETALRAQSFLCFYRGCFCGELNPEACMVVVCTEKSFSPNYKRSSRRKFKQVFSEVFSGFMRILSEKIPVMDHRWVVFL